MDGSQLLRRAVAALADAGPQPEEPICAGDLHRQGKGTHYAIVTAAGKVTVSTLVPFIRRRRAAPDSNGRACDGHVSAGFGSARSPRWLRRGRRAPRGG
jgi:hypothetical protein